MRLCLLASRHQRFCDIKIIWRKFSAGAKEGVSRDKWRVLFLGSDEFSIKSFEAVAAVFPTPARIHVIVSNANNTLAKYVKTLNSELNIDLDLWEQFKRRIVQGNEGETKLGYDIGVVSSFGYLLPSKVIQQCHRGILNVHGSLLPRWRGAGPTAAAIIHGDDVTGVSIMRIAAYRFDIGPILHQVKIPIDTHIRTPELTAALATLGKGALKEVLLNLDTYTHIALPQNESEATKAPKLASNIGCVQWDTMDALEIYNLFRGIHGRYKLKTKYRGHIVDLDDLSILASDSSTEKSNFSDYYGYSATLSIPLEEDAIATATKPGDIIFRNNVICVKCHSPSDELKRHWIFIRKLKINQKWITAKDFNNGWLSKGGEIRFASIQLPTLKETIKAQELYIRVVQLNVYEICVGSGFVFVSSSS